MPGVLVFVEQHHRNRLAHPRPPGTRVSHRRCGGHLRAEVHHLVGAHPGPEGIDQRQERRAFVCVASIPSSH